MSDFVKKLNFESDTFSGIKRDMTFVLQRLLANMLEKGSTEASMALKIDVSLDTEFIPNFDSAVDGETRRINKPKFKHQVTSTVQIRDKKDGNMDTEMELAYDEDNGEYVIKPVANTEQKSIFDDDFQDSMAGSETEKENGKKGKGRKKGTPQLPGPTDEGKKDKSRRKGAPQLPGPMDEEVIDGDFEEVEDGQGEDNPEKPEGSDEGQEPESLDDVTDELLDDDDEDSGDYDYDEPEDE